METVLPSILEGILFGYMQVFVVLVFHIFSSPLIRCILATLSNFGIDLVFLELHRYLRKFPAWNNKHIKSIGESVWKTVLMTTCVQSIKKKNAINHHLYTIDTKKDTTKTDGQKNNEMIVFFIDKLLLCKIFNKLLLC